MGGSHRDNAQFGRAKWRKTLLLPCWIAQIAILLGLMGLFSYRLSHTVQEWKSEEDKGNIPMIELVWESVNVAFSLTSLIITLVSLSKFIAEELTPLPMVFGNILSLVLSGAIMALDIVVYVKHADKQYSIIGLVMDIALMFFTIIPTFYSAVIYRRLLAYDDYHIPGNVKPFGYGGAEDVAEDNGNNNNTYYSSSSSAYLQPPTAYYDPTDNPSAAANNNTRPRSLSAGRRISLSMGLSRTPSPQPQPAPSPYPDLSGERRASYDHRRDTQYDEYVARRASGGGGRLSRDDVERALGTEFGWDDDNRHGRRRSGSGSGSGSITAARVRPGLVSVAQARTRGNSLGRQTSWEASLTAGSGSGSPSINIETPTPTSPTADGGHPGVQRGHSLVSVPEAHEEEGDGGGSGDRDALLGGGRISPGSSSRSTDSGGSGGGRGRGDFGRVGEGFEEIELESRKRRRSDS